MSTKENNELGEQKQKEFTRKNGDFLPGLPDYMADRERPSVS